MSYKDNPYCAMAARRLAERDGLARALDNLRRRRESALRRAAPSDISGVDSTRPHVAGGGADDTLTVALELCELRRQIDETEEAINHIDVVLDQLCPAHSRLLRAWYISRLTKEDLAEELGYRSLTSVYELRERALYEFAVLYFGVDALRGGTDG